MTVKEEKHVTLKKFHSIIYWRLIILLEKDYGSTLLIWSPIDPKKLAVGRWYSWGRVELYELRALMKNLLYSHFLNKQNVDIHTVIVERLKTPLNI